MKRPSTLPTAIVPAAILPAAILLAATLPAAGADLDAVLDGRAKATLRDEFRPLVQRPLQHLGYSFPESDDLMERMAANGADAVLTNLMWIPRRDPDAPDGLGYSFDPEEGDIARAARFGKSIAAAIGNWNNPGFTYYPEWFFEEFPQAKVLDAEGEPILGGGMLGRSLPSPNISTAEIVEGTTRFIARAASAHADTPHLAYWALGGESMYATYSHPDRWTDYSGNEIHRWRQWLASVRYDGIDALNRRWEASHESFEDIEPPRAPEDSRRWVDWLDFRFDAMGERNAWMWQAVRAADPARPAFSTNHGNPFHGGKYAAMGADFARFAWNSDGFEAGQIIEGVDGDLFNILVADAMRGAGKPYAPARLAYRSFDASAPGGSRSYTPEAVWRYGLESLGAGAWHLGFIEYDGVLPDGDWTIRDTPAEQATIEFFAWARSIRAELEHMQPLRPQVGLYFSHEQWAVDGFQPEWMELHRELARRHVPKVLVHDLQLAANTPPRVDFLVSPGASRADGMALRGILVRSVRGGRTLWANEVPGPQSLALFEAGGPLMAMAPSLTMEQIAEGLQRLHPLVRIDSLGQVRRPAEDRFAAPAPDDPLDLSTVAEAGQTVPVRAEGLASVSLRMPTYYGVAEQGFRFVLRGGGPAGDLLQEGAIGGPIGDNAWVEIPVEAEVAAGSILYIGVSVDDSVGATTLGWWGSTSPFIDGGTAWIDGEPVEADREVVLAFAETIPAADAVLASALTDGLSAMLVLINTGLDEAEVEVDLRPLLAQLPPFERHRLRVLRGQASVDARRDAVPARIAPSDGLVLLVEPVVPDAVRAGLREAAASAYAAWEDAGALTDFHRFAAAEADRLRGQARLLKAAAMDLALASSLGFAVEVLGDDDAEGPALRVRVLDAEGRALEGLVLMAEFTPTNGAAAQFPEFEPGVYTLDHLDRLPPRYDFRARRYEPFHGPLRVHLSTTHGQREASTMLDLVVPRSAPGSGLGG